MKENSKKIIRNQLLAGVPLTLLSIQRFLREGIEGLAIFAGLVGLLNLFFAYKDYRDLKK